MTRGTSGTRPVRFKIEFESCPVEAGLGVLGRKWALLILRNIALFRVQRFNAMLRVTPGLTKRVLALRLAELEREGFIRRLEKRPSFTQWELTEKGQDVLPVLMTLVRFASKWHADQVFADKRPRPLNAVFEEAYIRRILEVPKTARPRRAAARLPHDLRFSSEPAPLSAPS